LPQAIQPIDARYGVPSCAAVCVYPNLVRAAKMFVGSSGVRVAAVATAFPSGQMPLPVKFEDTRMAKEECADEIDMVIDRGAFLAGDFNKVFDEIAATKEVCGETHLKVILKTGELGSYDHVRQASELAMRAGGDFIKTSPAKFHPRQRFRSRS
jgi:deoxyribose-phosphate aldolase